MLVSSLVDLEAEEGKTLPFLELLWVPREGQGPARAQPCSAERPATDLGSSFVPPDPFQGSLCAWGRAGGCIRGESVSLAPLAGGW